MTQIVPAILVESQEAFEKNLRAVEDGCSLIQLDVLDDSLFHATTWYDAQAIGKMRPKIAIELHLMVENPIPIVEQFKQYVPTLERAIVSAEMHRPLGVVVGHIRDVLGLKVGVAINPETPLHEIESVLHDIDQLTIMGVHPGAQGQVFGDNLHIGNGEAIFEKIRQTGNHCPNLTIELDGGVTEELIPKLVQAGVDRLCIGSLLFRSPNPREKLMALTLLI